MYIKKICFQICDTIEPWKTVALLFQQKLVKH